ARVKDGSCTASRAALSAFLRDLALQRFDTPEARALEAQRVRAARERQIARRGGASVERDEMPEPYPEPPLLVENETEQLLTSIFRKPVENEDMPQLPPPARPDVWEEIEQAAEAHAIPEHELPPRPAERLAWAPSTETEPAPTPADLIE